MYFYKLQILLVNVYFTVIPIVNVKNLMLNLSGFSSYKVVRSIRA
jgi:hypothetical protein